MHCLHESRRAFWIAISAMLGNMSSVRPRQAALLVALCALSPLSAFAQKYKAVRVDDKGRLHIVSDAGKETVVSKTRGQTSFADVTISPDRRTVVWEVMARDPTRDYFSELAFALGVFRDGRVLRIIPTEPILWDWEFRDDGKRIAYATGSTHGGATEAFLRDVASGRLLAEWTFFEHKSPMPDWAAPFRELFPAPPEQ
jgi:hypothetical protein